MINVHWYKGGILVELVCHEKLFRMCIDGKYRKIKSTRHLATYASRKNVFIEDELAK